jgi:alcohol dehydrogenase
VVPTTSGTGSETTMVAVIADTDRGVKMPFTSAYLMPDVAILDPRMTLSLPPLMTAATAMDALTHAIEAYTCLAANPISDACATAAIARISRYLLPVMDQPNDTEGRLELAQAATLAGMAFSNSMVGLVHALGHSAGAVCHVPHGVCMSLFLPYALRFNMDVNGARLGELLLPLTDAATFVATPEHLRAQRVIDTLLDLRDALHERCALPRTLRETGRVGLEHLTRIAELTLDDGAIIFNPKEVDHRQVMAILEAAWG